MGIMGQNLGPICVNKWEKMVISRLSTSVLYFWCYKIVIKMVTTIEIKFELNFVQKNLLGGISGQNLGPIWVKNVKKGFFFSKFSLLFNQFYRHIIETNMVLVFLINKFLFFGNNHWYKEILGHNLGQKMGENGHFSNFNFSS